MFASHLHPQGRNHVSDREIKCVGVRFTPLPCDLAASSLLSVKTMQMKESRRDEEIEPAHKRNRIEYHMGEVRTKDGAPLGSKR